MNCLLCVVVVIGTQVKLQKLHIMHTKARTNGKAVLCTGIWGHGDLRILDGVNVKSPNVHKTSLSNFTFGVGGGVTAVSELQMFG